MTGTMATPEVARYYTETTPSALRDRTRGAGPDLALVNREALSWQDWASCAETDPEAWFPEGGKSPAAAKRICEGCPVQSECLEYAVREGMRYGVWGGTTERERRLIAARERKPARVTPDAA